MLDLHALDVFMDGRCFRLFGYLHMPRQRLCSGAHGGCSFARRDLFSLEPAPNHPPTWDISDGCVDIGEGRTLSGIVPQSMAEGTLHAGDLAEHCCKSGFQWVLPIQRSDGDFKGIFITFFFKFFTLICNNRNHWKIL